MVESGAWQAAWQRVVLARASNPALLQVSLTVYPSARSDDLIEATGTDSSWIASDGTCLNVAGTYFLSNAGSQQASFEIALLQFTFEIETQRSAG